MREQTMNGTRSKVQTAMIAAGLGGLLFSGGFGVLGVTAANYRPLQDTISALELTNLGLFQRINFLVFGVLMMIFAVALKREITEGPGAWSIPAFQLVTAIGVIGDAIFIHNPVHIVCDLIAFNAALVVLFLFAWRFRGDLRWRNWSAYSVVTALAMMGFLACFGIANHRGGPAGLMEKIASFTRTIWSVAFVAKLLANRNADLLSQPTEQYALRGEA